MDSPPRIDDGLLSNCTVMVLSVEFGLAADALARHNSTALLTLLGDKLGSADLTMSRRTLAKDLLHDCVYPIPKPSHTISAWHKLVWSAVFVAMLVVAIVGNAIVTWIVIGESSARAGAIETPTGRRPERRSDPIRSAGSTGRVRLV